MDGVNSSEIELSGSLYRVKCLHEVPDLIHECCNLINKEWKRSHTARLRSIEGSSENFPMSLVLLKIDKKPEVVGHCKISKLSMSRTKVFVETVVIHSLLRGKGLGKFLMSKAEDICKRKNIQWIYLATKGQEGFYEKLGYTKCAPVSIYGCQFNDSDEDIKEVEGRIKVVLTTVHFNKNNKNNTNNNNNTNNTASFPPPPAPPLPQMSLKTFCSNMPSMKTFMKKKLF